MDAPASLPYEWYTAITLIADLLIRVGLSVRVIMRQLPVGVSLAWLAVILIFPFAGAIVYLLFGEYRLGRTINSRLSVADHEFRAWQHQLVGHDRIAPEGLGPDTAASARVAESLLMAPVLGGNRIELLPDADAGFAALIADIDASRTSCHLAFYIWSGGGRADDVAAALIRAAQRGVACRLLLDAIGSATFLGSPQAAELRQGGVDVRPALPTSLLRALIARPDLRLHRKIVLIDETTGYTGSLNLADPRLFKREAGVGQWVDAMVRLHGPCVAELARVFLEDWSVATGIPPQHLLSTIDLRRQPHQGASPVQVLASGPAVRVEAIEQIVVMALYDARSEVVLTTPYFVPSETMIAALQSAAARGVRVVLIVPAQVDSRMTHYASRAYQAEILRHGVQVARYQSGLLHTKSITIDGRLAVFGSLNLDPRSLRLNFEITLLIHDAEATAQIRALQQGYLQDSILLDQAALQARSWIERLAENTARLAGPIL